MSRFEGSELGKLQGAAVKPQGDVRRRLESTTLGDLILPSIMGSFDFRTLEVTFCRLIFRKV